ncbi:RNA polymerase sigma factor [Lacipirellula parvula]|uniref:RNA polymerase sigma factor n=1 Tax=Lacipirellula parvula TaxID=2650471 RepID=UPI001562D0D4|nr:RNA polymerase sigma factor [Lacipirellula parvula]
MTIPRQLRLSLIAGWDSNPPAADGTTGGGDLQGTRGATAVDELLAVHADVVYRYALRLVRNAQLAEDLTQETFLRGWRQRAKLREPAAARVWLLRIATNLHRDGLRTARPTAELEAEPACSALGAAGRLEQQETVDAVLATLDALPPRQRQAIHLVTIEQLSNEEAAEVLEISVEALRASLSLARRTMRERLKPIDDELRGVRTEI